MGYVKPGVRKGEVLEVEIREKRCRAEACGWPFYDTAKYGHRRRT
jgi:glycine cleavage system aminomethyltransferase T